jgi:hypothetical protein
MVKITRRSVLGSMLALPAVGRIIEAGVPPAPPAAPSDETNVPEMDPVIEWSGSYSASDAPGCCERCGQEIGDTLYDLCDECQAADR